MLATSKEKQSYTLTIENQLVQAFGRQDQELVRHREMRQDEFAENESTRDEHVQGQIKK
jgi:hypothetical protein